MVLYILHQNLIVFFFNLKFIFYLKLYHKYLEKYIIDEFHNIFRDMNTLSTNVIQIDPLILIFKINYLFHSVLKIIQKCIKVLS